MVKKSRKWIRKKSLSTAPSLVGDSIYALLKSMGGSPQRGRLAGLWKQWDKVMGENFAWVAPLGHKDNILYLGVEDALEMQELSLLSGEILARVNDFMREEYFTRLKISLTCYGKNVKKD